MDKDLQRQLEDMEEASERWRQERRRLNAEIDKLETALSDAKTDTSRKRGSSEKGHAGDSRTIARIQEAADQKLKRAGEEWEKERAKLASKINRLEGALAEAIARASNPLRVTQSVKEQFELELNRVVKEKTELEQAFLRGKTEWEQEKLKMTGEAVKLRRAAQIMGRPVPKDDAHENNAKVRDLQNQLKENHAQWNTQREQFVAQIQKLEESSRQWDTERRKLSDHAGQLQESLTQAQAKAQTSEVASRKPKQQLEELKREFDEARRENQDLVRQLQESRKSSESEQRRLTAQIGNLEQQLKQISSERQHSDDEAFKKMLNGRGEWEAEQQRLLAQIEELERKLQKVSEKRQQVSNEVVEQLRQQYEQRIHEAMLQRAKLAEELQSASALLEAERSRSGESHKDGATNFDTKAVEQEIERVQGSLNEIVSIIENPNSELTLVIRKNVEKAELDSYLKGILFTLGRK
jgi:chromosome segregation ATPase